MQHTDGPKGSVCPYLGTLSQEFEDGPPIEYPSFENRCLATETADALLLTDQATFCLCSGFRYCPRYQAAAAFDGLEPAQQGTTAGGYLPSNPGPLDSEQLYRGLGDLEAELGADVDRRRGNRARWGWIGVAAIFVSVFLCGGIAAVYTGWQLVNDNLTTAQGNVATLANPTETPLPVYVILTATSPPDAVAAAPTAANEFPVAVTPTPMQGNTAPAVVLNGTPGAGNGQPAAGSAPPAIIAIAPTPLPPTPTALLVPAPAAPLQPLPELNAAVPTRRDTPDPALLQIPASTPLTETPTPLPTPTATATSGPLVVVFGPEETELKAGKCTLVHWNVENVREVYYENLPVNGRGEKEECVDSKDGLYTLTVILTSGEPKIYTTTVTILEPTPTATPTQTFTPIPEHTPTWTPVPPTNTPQPSYQYGVLLVAADGESHSCTIGQSCAVGLLVTNTGDTVDTLSVSLSQSGPWSGQLCRQDGVCSADRLSLVNVGEANTAYITLKVNVPAEATPSDESFEYRIRAASEGSGGSVASSELVIRLKAQ